MTTSISNPIVVPEAGIDLYVAAGAGYASTAGVLVQNVSQTEMVWLTFGATVGARKAGYALGPGESYYDKNGSANCWATSVSGLGKVQVGKD